MPTMCLLEVLVISRIRLEPTEVEKNFHGKNQVAHRSSRSAAWKAVTRGD